MNPFALIFNSLLIATHGYLFWNLRRAFGGGKWQFAFLVFFLAVLAVRYNRVYFLDHPRLLPVLDAFNYWLAFLVVSSVCLLAGDILRILGRLVDLAAGTDLGHWLAASRSGPLFLGLCLVVYGYSLYEAHDIRIRHIAVKTDKLPPGADRLRLVALADIHLDRIIDVGRLERMVDLANRQEADLALVLGDVVDADMTRRDAEVEALRKLKGPLGKFAVLGNHEAYSGLSQAIEFLARSGLTLLRGKVVEVGGIAIAGVDDPATRGWSDSVPVLAGADQDKFVLLLSHRPRVPAASVGRFDLQLSGHTHGGQIFPGRLFTWLINGYPQGMTELPAGTAGGKKSLLYISNGAGFWGPPARLLTPPEITVVVVERGG